MNDDDANVPASEPPPLNYQGPQDAPPRIVGTISGNAALGCMSGIAALAIVIFTLVSSAVPNQLVGGFLLLSAGAVLALATYVSFVARRRGFLGGLLLGLGLLFLTGIGLLAVVCGNMKFN